MPIGTNKKIVYEFLYTSIGQAIAAYAPNEYFAAVMNPVLIGAGLVSFCGVVVPYSRCSRSGATGFTTWTLSPIWLVVFLVQ